MKSTRIYTLKDLLEWLQIRRGEVVYVKSGTETVFNLSKLELLPLGSVIKNVKGWRILPL